MGKESRACLDLHRYKGDESLNLQRGGTNQESHHSGGRGRDERESTICFYWRSINQIVEGSINGIAVGNGGEA